MYLAGEFGNGGENPLVQKTQLHLLLFIALQPELAKILNVRERGKVSSIQAHPYVKLHNSTLISQNQDQRATEKFTFLQTKNLTHISVFFWRYIYQAWN